LEQGSRSADGRRSIQRGQCVPRGS
jgi:hypothetical protein